MPISFKPGLWKGFAIRDGNLITGQQNFSAAKPSMIIETLGDDR